MVAMIRSLQDTGIIAGFNAICKGSTWGLHVVSHEEFTLRVDFLRDTLLTNDVFGDQDYAFWRTSSQSQPLMLGSMVSPGSNNHLTLLEREGNLTTLPATYG